MSETKPKEDKKVGDKKLGQILLENHFITSEQLAEAMAMQMKMNSNSGRKFKLGEILLFQKSISLQQLHDALRFQTKKASGSRKEMEAIQRKYKILEEITGIEVKETEANEKQKKTAETKKDEGFLSFLRPKEKKA